MQIIAKEIKNKIIIEFDYPFEWDFVNICREYNISWDAVKKIRFLDFSSATLPLKAEDLVDQYSKLFDKYPDSAVNNFLTIFNLIIKKYTLTTPRFIEHDLSSFRDVDDYQKVAVQFLLNKGSAILGDEPGVGKALDPETDILIPDGWCKLKNLKIGDKVGNSTGTFSNVKGIYPQPKKKFYRFYFNDGTFVDSSEDHLWNVQTHNDQVRKNGWKTLETKKIIKKIKNLDGQNIWRFPIVNPYKFSKKKLNINPYILGLLLGDGYLREAGIEISSGDKEIINYFSKYYKLTKMNNYDYRIFGVELKNKLKDLNLIGKKSNNKFIPEIYKRSSIQDRISLLQGLMDTDGWIDKRGIVAQYTTISKQLCEDIKFIVQSLGGLVTVNQKIPTYIYKGQKLNGQLCYTLTLKLPPNINPFKLSRKANLFKPKTKYLPNRILKKVKYIGKKEGICISVDSKDKLFTIKDFILTHNTRSATVYSLASKSKKTLIVCPLSVRYVWREELIYQGVKLEDIYIPEKDFELKKYVIINYDKLKKFQLSILKNKWDLMILDEGHMLKNLKSQRTKVALKIGKKCKNIVPLTGTAIMNRPIELFPLLKLINHPLGKGLVDFTKRYCDRKLVSFGPRSHWDINGASNIIELSEKLKGIMIRRLKKDCFDIPDKIYNTYHLPLPSSFKKEYEKVLKQYKSQFSNSNMSNHLSMINELRQICSKAKTSIIKEHIQDALENNEKILVFGFYNAGLEELHKEYPNSLLITGDTKKEEREGIVKKFQEDEYYKIFIGNIMAAGVGLTLTAGNRVIFNDLYWNPAIHMQAEDRSNRRGAIRETQIYYPLFENTIEVDIFELINKKKELILKIMDGSVNYYRDESIIKELINKFHAKFSN